MNEVFLDAMVTFFFFAVGTGLYLFMKIRTDIVIKNINAKDSFARTLPTILISLYFGLAYTVFVAVLSWYIG